MKKTIQTLVAGLMAANCLIACGETKTESGQTVTAIETAVVNACSNLTDTAIKITPSASATSRQKKRLAP